MDAGRPGETMMRRIMAAALLAIVCAAGAAAEENASGDERLNACVAAAGPSRVALEACRGVIVDPCADADGGETTSGAVRCYSAEERAWRALLEAALARAAADATRRPLLEPAQQAWRVWRDAECAYRASQFQGGSLARVLAAACVSDLTAARAIDLIHAERNQD
jgi:uncharacterized protein YecT (DUF1311 family)